MMLGKVGNHQNAMLVGGKGSIVAQLAVNDSRRVTNTKVITITMISTTSSAQMARRTPLLLKYKI